MTSQTDPPSAPPQYSPDGHWWWDGNEWVPVQPPRIHQQLPTQPQRRRSLALWLIAGTVALVGLLVVAVVVAAAFFSPIGTQVEMGTDPEFDQFYCETFPEDC